MPVEIKELVIRAVVDYDKVNSPTQSKEELSNEPDPGLVQAVVKQVLKILKQRQKR